MKTVSFLNEELSGKWEITNQRKDASPLLGFHPLFRSMTKDITEKFQLDLEVKFLVQFQNRHVKMAAFMPDWERLGSKTVKHLERADFIEWISSGLVTNGQRLYELGNVIRLLSVNALSNEELTSYFNKSVSTLDEFVRFNQFVNTADFYHNKLTDHLLSILGRHLSEFDSGAVNRAYNILTTPKNPVWIQDEQEDMLRLLASIQSELEKGITQELAISSYLSNFEKHSESYFWIKYEQEGPIQTPQDFLTTAINMLQTGVDAKQELDNLAARRKANLETFETTWKSTNLPKEHRQIFIAARELVYWKLHLREMKVRFYCCLDELMNEIGVRLGLNKTQVRHLTEIEIIESLTTHSHINPHHIDERIEHSVYCYSLGNIEISTGAAAQEAFSVVSQDLPSNAVSIVTGTCGQPGKATGRVRQVLTVGDMADFKQGEILVAFMTDVGIVPAMRRASAIVTDVGGVTCHAAIVAREFGIPCIIGTKVGTEALRDGYFVDIDADKGLVEIKNRMPFSTKDETKASTHDDTPISSENWSPLPQPSRSKSTIECFPGVPILDDQSIGGKAASLRKLCRIGFSVPSGFVVSSETFLEFSHSANIADKIYGHLIKIVDGTTLQHHSHLIRELIIKGTPSVELNFLVRENFLRLSARFVAVRSSAPMEDAVDASWAGQLDTYLNTTSIDLIENIKRCWASRFSAHALAYGLDCKNEAYQFSTAVIVQNMVNSRIAGTAFSIHPNDKSGNTLVIESCAGLGELLVSGREIPVTYIIDRQTFNVIEISGLDDQKMTLRTSEHTGGNELVELSETDRSTGQLQPDEIENLCSTVINIEREFGFPVDVEWAIEGADLYIVQCRPITNV